MTSAPEYEPTAGADIPTSSSASSSTELLRALTLAVDDATVGSLSSARSLLAQGTPDADRSAMRMIAVWLMSHPEAVTSIRSRLRAR